MTTILFSGCSLVEGTGFNNRKQEPSLFCNIFTKEVFGSDAKLDNIAVGGNSNERIFLDSAAKLTQSNYDYAFICWTALHRYVFWAGLETYSSRYFFTPYNKDFKEFQGNNNALSSKDLQKANDLFVLLNHAHYYIRDLINYVNILKSLADSKNTKIFFINSVLPWDFKFFNYIDNDVVPAKLTRYTNELLNSVSRDDNDISILYQQMHKDYSDVGGIREELWLNLYQNIRNMMVDTADDNDHPGYQSNKIIADFLINRFKEQ